MQNQFIDKVVILLIIKSKNNWRPLLDNKVSLVILTEDLSSFNILQIAFYFFLMNHPF
jgi:hypothetical protein